MEDNQSASPRSTQATIGTNSPLNNSSNSTSSDQSVSGASKGAESVFLRELIDIFHRMAEPMPKESRLRQFVTTTKQFLSHPLFLLLVGSFLGVVVGGRLTYVYTRRAQEVAATRSFSDELNKLRIQKVGEVWEHLDQDEVAIERLINELTDNDADQATQKNVLEQLRKLIEADKEIIGQHRFWLGKATYDKIQHYLDITIILLTRKILEPESDVESLVKDRDAARSDIESERVKFLNSETVQVPDRCYLF